MGVFVGCFSPMGVFVMDPNACFDRIEECIVNEDWDGAREHVGTLAIWLGCGGFAPYGMDRQVVLRLIEMWGVMLTRISVVEVLLATSQLDQ